MTWLDLPPGTGFGVANLPFGVFSRVPAGPAPRAGPRPQTTRRARRPGGRRDR